MLLLTIISFAVFVDVLVVTPSYFAAKFILGSFVNCRLYCTGGLLGYLSVSSVYGSGTNRHIA